MPDWQEDPDFPCLPSSVLVVHGSGRFGDMFPGRRDSPKPRGGEMGRNLARWGLSTGKAGLDLLILLGNVLPELSGVIRSGALEPRNKR